jgi:hypothetical protein
LRVIWKCNLLLQLSESRFQDEPSEQRTSSWWNPKRKEKKIRKRLKYLPNKREKPRPGKSCLLQEKG